MGYRRWAIGKIVGHPAFRLDTYSPSPIAHHLILIIFA